jgi:hypothetical protein
MTTLNVLRGGRQPAATEIPDTADRPADGPSVVSALSALVDDARAGRLTATTSGDLWVLLRMEEALQDCGEIRQMATRDHPSHPAFAAGATAPASIQARRLRALA